jgi:hypothetical protein
MWFGGMMLIVSLICLFLILLLNYQSSDVVIRTTYFDGRVEVIGGRVPWRRPDFEAKNGIELFRKDGTRCRVKKLEMWFRDADSRKRLTAAFRGLETFSEQQTVPLPAR